MARLEMPAMLVEACDGDEDLLAWIGTLRESWQRHIGRWIMEPKSDAARLRRADDFAERLLRTMEAEEELPPLLAQRLKRAPHAMAGWRAWSVNQRRDYLLIFFGAKGEAARETQVARIVELAAVKGKRAAGAGGSRGSGEV